jgi:hypothetical protein
MYIQDRVYTQGGACIQSEVSGRGVVTGQDALLARAAGRPGHGRLPDPAWTAPSALS